MSTKVQVYDARIAVIHKLRVNVKSLAAEARIIRAEEQRCGWLYREDLSLHRRGRLRREARLAQLALAFVRQKAYLTVEQSTREPVVAGVLASKLNRYVPGGVSEAEVYRWLHVAD